MFAVLKTGGKQYRVQSGDLLRVEKLAADAGETIQFNEILMLGGDTTQVGAPFIDDAAVQATVIDQIKGEKLINFVKRRRKHSSKRTRGHRQKLTLLRVTEILAEGAANSGVRAATGTRSAGKSAATMEPAAASTNAKAGKPDADIPAKAEEISKVAQDGGSAEAIGRAPSNLLTEARGGKPDNLKKIGGVGPKLESVLHENGVYHFDQISAWTEEEVAHMDERLSFKGRIARDNWIEQAKKFAAEEE
jgi:large subunit ribosomal protein L21